jgi:hypothetical protein
MWQLKRLSTGEALNEPQDLPDNWKNISSLKGSIDRLNDLLGPVTRTWAGLKSICLILWLIRRSL